MMLRLLCRMTLLLPALLLSAGCAGVPAESPGPYPDPARYEVRGIDISAHNGEIDFGSVREAGYDFVIAKASEGATFRDRRFIDNLRLAREAGLRVGAYHFFRFDTSGYMQALNFAAAVEGRRLDIPLVIDLEEWTNPTFQATPLVTTRLVEMIDCLEARGYRVMLYTNKNGYNRFLRTLPRSYPLWICSLGDEPETEGWTLWQATHSGRVPGSDHPVDINVFSGNMRQWEAFLSGERQ